MRKFLFILILSTASCQDKIEIIPVDHFYDIKVERLKYDKLEECKADAIFEAEQFVDQLIDKWIKSQSTKEDDFPLKPRRPNAPQKIIGQD